MTVTEEEGPASTSTSGMIGRWSDESKAETQERVSMPLSESVRSIDSR